MFDRTAAFCLSLFAAAGPAWANGPITVEEAVEQALDSSPAIQELAANLAAAEAAAGGVWRRYTPELSIHGGLQRNEVRGVSSESVTDGGIVGGTTSTSRSFSDPDTRVRYGASLEQFLLDFGGFAGTLEAREIEILAARAALESTRLDVARDVKIAYWTLAEREAAYEHRRAMVEAHEQRLGRIPGGAWTAEEARLDLARERAALLAAEQRLAEASIDFRGGFGDREEPPRPLASTLSLPSVDLTLERSVELALETLPGLERLRVLVKVAEAERQAVRAELLPRLSAFAGIHAETPVTSSTLNQLTILSGGVVLRVPTEGLFGHARVEEADAAISRAKAKLASEESRVRKEVEKRYTALFDAIARARLAGDSAAASHAHVERVGDAFSRGRVDFRTSAEALRHLDEAEIRRLRALLEARKGLAELERAVGRTL